MFFFKVLFVRRDSPSFIALGTKKLISLSKNMCFLLEEHTGENTHEHRRTHTTASRLLARFDERWTSGFSIVNLQKLRGWPSATERTAGCTSL